MSGLAVQLKNVCVIKNNTPQATNLIEGVCGACNNLCEYKEIVFASDEDSNHKKDYSDFLFKKLVSSDVITLELWRDSYKVADLNNDLLGTFYDGFTVQPNYIGYLIDWSKVFNLYSGGTYFLKANLTILGESTIFNSRKFKLYKYDAQLAHRTVKIESYQTGNILSSNFDYTDLLPLGWYSSIRVNGTFGEKAPNLEVDKYFNTIYQEKQNREQIINEYVLRVDFVPQNVADIINENNILANDVFITDYNINSSVQYRQKSVSPQSIETEPFDFGKFRYVITVRDRQQDIIKRNV